MGGWSDIETVQKFYLKNTDENEKRAVKVLDNLMAGKIVWYLIFLLTDFDTEAGVNS